VSPDEYYAMSQPLEVFPLPAWAAAFTLSLDLTFPCEQVMGEQALALLPDPSVNDEYCWVHVPGGWTCTECRQSEQADPMQLVTREG